MSSRSERERVVESGERSIGTLTARELQDVFVTIRSEVVSFLFRRTRNRAIAEDLSHDVFEKLANVQAPIPTVDKARSYILRTAANLAIDQHRVRTRRTEILEGAQVLFEDTEPSPEAIVMSRDQLRLVERALNELPPKMREVLMLARVHGMRRKEIAVRLGVSVSLVEKHQLAALLHLRDRLGSDF